MSAPRSSAERIDSIIAPEPSQPGGARRRDDRRRLAEPLDEGRAQEPLGHRRAADVARADHQDPAHDEERESSNDDSSGRTATSTSRGTEPLPDDRRRPVGEVDDGRRDSVQCPLLAQVDGDGITEQRLQFAAGLCGRAAGEVRAGDGERPGLCEEREREGVVRGADADGGCRRRRGPTAEASAPLRQHQGERSRPQRRREALGPLVEDRHRSRRIRRGDQHRELEISGPTFRLEHPRGRRGIVGARPRPVDGVGREDDQLTAAGGGRRVTQRTTEGGHRSRVIGSGVTGAAAAARTPRGPVRPDHGARRGPRSPPVRPPPRPTPSMLLLDLDGKEPPGSKAGDRLREEPFVEVDPTEDRELRFGSHVGRQRVTLLGRPRTAGCRRPRPPGRGGRAAEGSSRLPLEAVTVHAEESPTFSRASATASGERSTANTVASGRSSLIASAHHAAPRAHVDHHRRLDLRRSIERPPGRGPRSRAGARTRRVGRRHGAGGIPALRSRAGAAHRRTVGRAPVRKSFASLRGQPLPGRRSQSDPFRGRAKGAARRWGTGLSSPWRSRYSAARRTTCAGRTSALGTGPRRHHFLDLGELCRPLRGVQSLR